MYTWPTRQARLAKEEATCMQGYVGVLYRVEPDIGLKEEEHKKKKKKKKKTGHSRLAPTVLVPRTHSLYAILTALGTE